MRLFRAPGHAKCRRWSRRHGGPALGGDEYLDSLGAHLVDLGGVGG